MLIGLFTVLESSYDRFHTNADRVFRITMANDVSTPPPLAGGIVHVRSARQI